MTAQDGALLVIDLQERLLATMSREATTVANALRLVKAARLLNIPVKASEQAPEKLGGSIPEVRELVPNVFAKTAFACDEGEIASLSIGRNPIRHVTLVGVESHVCVAQTALRLLDRGYAVQVPADAVTSRRDMDWEFALRRLEQAGVIVSTTEAVLFEWTEHSDRAEFKAISGLVKSFDDRTIEGTDS